MGSNQAQTIYSLQDCINIALKNNISLQQQQLQTQSVKADALQSKLATLPSVNASATNNWQTGFAINPRTNLPEEGVTFRTNSFGINANMPLFNGFQTTNNLRMQQVNYAASAKDLESTKNNISLNVCNAYLRVLLNQELENASRTRVDATQKQVERQNKLYELGSSNKTRLLQLKAQLANEELALVNAQNQTIQSYTDLWLLLNLKPDSSWKIVSPDYQTGGIGPEPRDANQIYDEFSKQSRELQATKERMRSSELQRLIALGGRSPRINFNASLSSFYTTQSTETVGTPTLSGQREIGYWIDNGVPVPVYVPVFSGGDIRVKSFSNQFSQNFGSTIGLSLQVPLFNGWNVNTNVQKANINRENARLNAKQTENNLYRTIATAVNDFKAAHKRYLANVQNFEANQEAFQLGEKQFELGALNIIEYLNTKNNLIRAEADLTQAKYELVFRRKVLDFYLGRPLY